MTAARSRAYARQQALRQAARPMESDQYLGWLALALTPGLGARMAGKLLREMGSPDAIFNASLTALEAQRLPAARKSVV